MNFNLFLSAVIRRGLQVQPELRRVRGRRLDHNFFFFSTGVVAVQLRGLCRRTRGQLRRAARRRARRRPELRLRLIAALRDI